jgi:hypothetical protein
VFDLRLPLVVQVGRWLLRPMSAMTRTWIEMPVVQATGAGHADRPKYPPQISSLLVYRGSKVYVRLPNVRAARDVVKNPDVRLLTDIEARAFEESLPFAPSSGRFTRGDTDAWRFGLGDLVSWVAHRVGIAECSGCRKRRALLNRVVIWRRERQAE